MKTTNGASERALNWLRSGLRAGRYAPGQRLREVDLVQEAPVSKAPLREALQVLAQEGLISIQPRRGFVVRRFSAKEIADVFELLVPLSQISAHGAAISVRKGASPVALKKATEAAKEAAETGDVIAFAQAADNWRTALEKLSDNAFLEAVIRQIRGPLLQSQLRKLMRSDFLTSIAQEYNAVTKAVVAGEAKNASNLITTHVENIGALLVSAAQKSELQ